MMGRKGRTMSDLRLISKSGFIWQPGMDIGWLLLEDYKGDDPSKDQKAYLSSTLQPCKASMATYARLFCPC